MLRLLYPHLFTASLFAVLAGPALALQSTQFGGQNIVTSGATAVADLSPADLDNDGDIDVAAALTGADRVVWYRQNATGTFTQRVLDTSMPNVTSIHTADLDGDGDMDIVAGAPGNNRITWYENLYDPNALGTNYCTAAFNSSGGQGTVSASGSIVVSDNDLTITASSLPNNSFGFFLVSQTQFFLPNPGGSQGNLCVAGDIGRYVGPGQIQNSGSTGTFSLLLDLNQVPQPTGLVSVQAGETWNFTTWFRDAIFGIPVSNFTDGFEITFQ